MLQDRIPGRVHHGINPGPKEEWRRKENG